MKSLLIAAILAAGAVGYAVAQERVMPPPGVLCPDGSDPEKTGIGCVPVYEPNAMDDGRARLNPRNSEIFVPNDPLGNNSTIVPMMPGGNSAMQPIQIR